MNGVLRGSCQHWLVSDAELAGSRRCSVHRLNDGYGYAKSRRVTGQATRRAASDRHRKRISLLVQWVRHRAMTQTTGRAPRVHAGVPNDGGTRRRDMLGPAPAGHHVRVSRTGSSGSAAGPMPAPFTVPIADRAAFLGVSAQVQHLAVRVLGHIGNAGDPAAGHGSTVPTHGQAGHGSPREHRNPGFPTPRIRPHSSIAGVTGGCDSVPLPCRFAANRPNRCACNGALGVCHRRGSH